MRLWHITYTGGDGIDMVVAGTAPEARRMAETFGLGDVESVRSATDEDIVAHGGVVPLQDPDTFSDELTVTYFAAEIAAREAEAKRIAEFQARQVVMPWA